MKRIACFLLLAILFSVVAAQAQNYTYTFYDGSNATGNIMATYTGPLLQSKTLGTNVGSDVVLNPSGLFMLDTSQPLGTPCGTQILASNLQPATALYIPNYNGPGTDQFLEFAPQSGFPGAFLITFFAQLPTSPGTYDTDNANFPAVGGIQQIALGPCLSQAILSLKITAPVGPNYTCTGFQSPFDVALSLNKKTNRAIPLKAQLFDGGNLVTPATLGTFAPPVVNVSYQSGSSPAIDETSMLDPLGQSSSGNQFSFDQTTQTWWFNLGTSTFTASGTYTVTLQSGGASYQVSPACLGQFVRQ